MMNEKQITSSIKLQFKNVVTIKSWLLLNLLDEEFVRLHDYAMLSYLQSVLNHEHEIGVVQFGKANGKLYEVDQTYYIHFEDGRTFSFVTPEII